MLDKLMGTPPTPPPPDTATDLSQKAGEQPKTVRARLEQHRDKATLQEVPRRDRSDRSGSGELRRDRAVADDGQPGATLRSMPARCCRTESRSTVWWNCGRNWSRVPDVFARTVTERLMMYAVNRQLEYFDMPQVRAIVRGGRERQLQAVVASSWESSIATRSASRHRKSSADGRRSERLTVKGKHMFITKKHISRRAVLKGAGVTLALPFLDAMVPAGTALAQTAAVPKTADRLLLHSPRRDHGQHVARSGDGQVDAVSGSGANFKLSPILASLEPYKKYVSSFGNLENAATAGSVHTFTPPRGSARPVRIPARPARTWPRRSIR